MFNIIEFKKNLIKVDHWTAFVLGAIVGKDGFNDEPVLLVKGKHLVIEHIGSGLLALAGIQLGKTVATVGGDDRFQVNTSYAFKAAGIKDIIA